MKAALRTLLLMIVGVACAGADWLHFRGTDNQAVALSPPPPTEIGADDAGTERNTAWKIPLPGRGVSSPIVIGGKVIVTAASGANSDRLHVFSIDSASGKIDWERQFWATGRTLCHPTSSVAANTPASDGKHIYAFFSSNDLACLDLAGNLLWYRGLTHEFPTAANDVGMSASPLVLGDVVILQVETKGESFAAGLDALTGATRWKIERRAQMNWTSPTVARGKTRADDIVLLQSTDRLTAHNPKSGEQLWVYERECGGIASPVAATDLVYVQSAGLTALRPKMGTQATEIAWASNALTPGSPSPVVDHGHLYVVNPSGVLLSADAATGEVKWKLRLKGRFWATPVIAGEFLYIINSDGIAQIVRLGDVKGEIVSEGTLGEPVLGTPAVIDGALFVRSDKHLWKFSSP